MRVSDPVARVGSGVAALALLLGVLAAPAGAAPSASPFQGRGGIEEAYVLGAPPGAHLRVVHDGRVVGSGVVDGLGALLVRNLGPGPGYRFETPGAHPELTAPFAVLATHSAMPGAFYAGQHLHVGLNYLTMRDGVRLAATVRLPPGKTLADGPFPTVIEYSGYNVAGPASLIDALEGKASTSNPLLPSTSTIVGSVIAPLLGFATVSLQMRGTGCSGGAFDLFGLDSDYDGYDAVQIVGSQPWVFHHKVGMVGISYSGFSQLIVAGTEPPDLAAITPLSPTDDLFSTGYPGGIYNNGFAKSWVQERISDAEAAPGGGQSWATAEIETGDRTCLANQVLHPEAQALVRLIGPDLGRVPSLFDQRSPTDWAAHIKVPVFLSGSLEDEQVGPQWPAIITALDHDPRVYVTMTNGTHIDSLGPDSISRWLEFLDVYVADAVPTPQPILDPLAAEVYASATSGAPALAPPPLRFTTEPTAAAARAAYAARTPRVEVLFDNGGGSLGQGALQPTATAGFSTWPPVGKVTTYYLGPGGSLSTLKPSGASAASFRPNPAVRPATDLPESANAWAAQPPYDWTPVPAKNGVAFQTAPFASNTTVVGPASLDLYLRSSAKVTDLQVTVTEVRPGANEEEYVTSGFLRSSNRQMSPAATALQPVPTYLPGSRAALPSGRYSLVRIPIDPLAHVFRAGTALRIVLSAPGGDRPAWAFATPDTEDRVLDRVAMGSLGASSLVLNVVGGVAAPATMPACGALRGEPCRSYAALSNET